MIVRLKERLLVVTAETEAERSSVAEWSSRVEGHVFALMQQDAQTIRLTDLGVRAEACRDPINVTSRSSDPAIRLISNFAPTPFELDGESYASVEGFWQGLKFPDRVTRREIAALDGFAAKRAGRQAVLADTLEYQGQTVRVGTFEHWQLMSQACWAKFTQHAEARCALLGTGERPLEHKVRHDSKTIPGVIMADIWMKIRRQLRVGVRY